MNATLQTTLQTNLLQHVESTQAEIRGGFTGRREQASGSREVRSIVEEARHAGLIVSRKTDSELRARERQLQLVERAAA